MNRPVVLLVAVTAFVASSFMVWLAVRDEREFRRLIAAGETALAADRTFDAIEAFSGALTIKRDSMLAHLKRGDSYLRHGEHAAALRDLGQASQLDPTAPRPIELLGDANAAMGRQARAVELYQRYVALDDRAPRVLYKLALAHYRNGQPTKAIDLLRRAVALDERVAEVHYLLGMSLRAERRHTEAMRALRRALALNPTFAAAREELADLHARLGQRRVGIEQLEALAALEPERPERLIHVGLTYARLGRPDAAILTLGRAAERYPQSAAVATALGRVWLDTFDLSQDPSALARALGALQPIAARVDATGEALALYGRALLLSGHAAAAERTLQQAVTRLPVEASAFQHLADAARRLGHAAIARDAARRHAALLPAV